MHIPLSQLRQLPGAGDLEDAWIRVRLGDDGYLTGPAARAAACDAQVVPVVTGTVNPDVIDQMINVARTAAENGSPEPPAAPGTTAGAAAGPPGTVRPPGTVSPPGTVRPASTAWCDIHHLGHHADGGDTSLANCLLLCQYHHDVCTHRYGWTLTLHPDGTTQATSPNGQRVLHSHAPADAHPSETPSTQGPQEGTANGRDDR